MVESLSARIVSKNPTLVELEHPLISLDRDRNRLPSHGRLEICFASAYRASGGDVSLREEPAA